jgi:hypothetical protein
MSEPCRAGDLAAIEVRELIDLAPLFRRAVGLDPASLVRIRTYPGAAHALVRLPFDVLVGRRIPGRFDTVHDATYATADLLGWLDGETPEPPKRDDAWRGGVPVEAGWRRLETVPDDVIRGLVAQGALTLREAAGREGNPRAQPRAEVTDALLDSIVLTVSDQSTEVEINLRLLSALVRMGFLARDSHLAVDVAGRWVRLAASYGSAYAERPGLGLGIVGSAANPHSGVGG